MRTFTNIGLVKHAKKALNEGWKYVYGTMGQVLTLSILGQKRVLYPDKIDNYIDLIKTFIGKRTTDCVNLIKSYFWWDEAKNDVVYDPGYDKYDGTWMSANGAFEKATVKGPISTIPDIPGICVRYVGHIGIYIGDGKVIEARATKYGVVQTELTDRPWTHWLEYPGITYVKEQPALHTSAPQWKIDGANYLVYMGYTTSLHDPLEQVDIGTLGTILKNMDEQRRK